MFEDTLVGLYGSQYRFDDIEYEVPTLEADTTLAMDKTGNHAIKDILDKEMAHLRITQNLVRELENYSERLMSKDDDHISFFGGNLTGVHKIVYTTDDRNTLAIDLLTIDEHSIRKQVRALEHIGSDWVRGTDGINLALLYVSYRLDNSSLSESLKRRGIMACLMILQFKLLSSMMNNYFKYPVSEKLALAVYNDLSRKFFIKKYRTWRAVLELRAQTIYDKDHTKTIHTYVTDERLQYVISDVQVRLKTMILNIYEVTMRLHASGSTIGSTGMLMQIENNIEVKDFERDFEIYYKYIIDTMGEYNAFVKKELVGVIVDSITTMPEKQFYDVIGVVVELAQKHDPKLESMVREIIIYTFEYLKSNSRSIRDTRNLETLLISLKGLFTASKTNHPTVLMLRDYFDKLVKKSITSKNPATIAGVRTGIILYIILRTISMNAYK